MAKRGRPTKAEVLNRQKQSFKNASKWLRIAANPTRLHIMSALRDGEQNVSSISAATGTSSQPMMSAHLKLLREANMVVGRRESRNIFYRLTPKGQDFLALMND